MSDKGASNTVLANLYGRSPTGSSRPVRVSANGSLISAPAPEVVTDWAPPIDVTLLTPLVAFAPFADDSAALILGMTVDASAIGSAVFTIEMSEDGVLPAKTQTVTYTLAPGEHDVWISVQPLLLRFTRVSVVPASSDPTKVAFVLRRVPR